MRIFLGDKEFSVKEAVDWELQPDAYHQRKRKERVADMLANLIKVMVEKGLLRAKDLDLIFQELNVEE
jgi:hypothetical protein